MNPPWNDAECRRIALPHPFVLCAGAILPVTLPFEFDTAQMNTLFLKGVVGLETICAVGIVYSLVMSHSLGAALDLTLIACTFAFFTSRMFKVFEGSVGIITAQQITVQQAVVFGIRLPGPVGTFRARDFTAIRIEEISGSKSGPHERVYLVGKPGVPNVLIARTGRRDVDRGIQLGRELGALLSLSCDQERVLY